VKYKVIPTASKVETAVIIEFSNSISMYNKITLLNLIKFAEVLFLYKSRFLPTMFVKLLLLELVSKLEETHSQESKKIIEVM